MIFSRRGQLDQIITSIIVLVAAVFISGIFIVISSNIASISALTSTPTSEISSSSSLSRALFDNFLSESITISSGARISVPAAFTLIGDRVHDRSFSDSDALSALTSLNDLFTRSYSCGGANRLALLAKDPSGNARLGAYWVLINAPALPFSNADTFFPPLSQINIIDAVNDPEKYIDRSSRDDLHYLYGLSRPPTHFYEAYPFDVDYLNERPSSIAIFHGEVIC